MGAWESESFFLPSIILETLKHLGFCYGVWSWAFKNSYIQQIQVCYLSVSISQARLQVLEIQKTDKVLGLGEPMASLDTNFITRDTSAMMEGGIQSYLYKSGERSTCWGSGKAPRPGDFKEEGLGYCLMLKQLLVSIYLMA